MVDQQAKTSHSLEQTSFKILFPNFKPSITKYVLDQWQTSLNNSIVNKLLEIKPTICEYQSVVRNIRKKLFFDSVQVILEPRIHTFFLYWFAHT